MLISKIEVRKYDQKSNTWNLVKDVKDVSSMDYVVYIDDVFYELGDLLFKLMEENRLLREMVEKE